MAILEGIFVNLISEPIKKGCEWCWRILTKDQNNSLMSSNKKNAPSIKELSKRLNFISHIKKKRQARLFEQMRESTVFFSYRFSEAFPGCREVTVFDNPADAIHRLDILLKPPLTASKENMHANPIWWFRGMNALHIKSYKRIKSAKNTQEFLMNVEHHRLSKIIAVSDPSYYRQFVYVEVDGMLPTGLYDLAHQKERRGYAREEYGEYGLWVFVKKGGTFYNAHSTLTLIR